MGYCSDYSMYKKYFEILSKVEKYYTENLIASKEATNYIESRGFKEEDVRRYGIGFSSNNLVRRTLVL